MIQNALEAVEESVKACRICSDFLPLGPRPIVQISRNARILIAGQAPGRKVHVSGIPFDDASGDRLRDWLGVDRDAFYDRERFAILPMGFCYPGNGKSGDLPPRPECAIAWRETLLRELRGVALTLVIGQYAMDWHLRSRAKASLTETVQAWREYAPELWPLPHPSPRNNIWLRKNSWFTRQVLPGLRQQVKAVLDR